MSLQELIKFYILQKNAHSKSPASNDFAAQQLYQDEYKKLMADVAYNCTEVMAPSLFENQPDIPFLFYTPQSATSETPAPLIVHTHGGPNVYIDKSNLHAEIAYFISHGFAVACPNYRGSTGYPQIGNDPIGWKKWEVLSKGKHHIYGPQDVYTVAKHVQEMFFIDKEKIYLRGGSFGSFINSYLLAEIKKGTYLNIFKGAHLSGGVNYPPAASMPEETPLLITHAVNDEISPFTEARFFMEKMMQKQLSFEEEGRLLDNLQLFISQSGNHHLINPRLQLNDEGSEAYQELIMYLQHTVGFIDALVHGKKYQLMDSYDQFKLVIGDRDTTQDLVKEILQRVHSYQIIRQLAQKKSAVKNELLTGEMPNKIHKKYYGPTRSLLKLKLGNRYTGVVKTDFVTYLKEHFAPINWSETQEKLTHAGNDILKNKQFVDQMVQVINNEEQFLQTHPDHMVMYHTAEPDSLQLYTFINLWQAILKGQSTQELPVIRELRLDDYMKNTFDEIQVFLLKMRQRKSSKEIFNNTAGFAERAIACNPSLISNEHSTASSSFWWYFNAKEKERAPIEIVVSDMLKILGICSKERMERYFQLFKREKMRLHEAPQALLQQIFVPYNIAEESAYMCQIWGEEFKKNPLNLESPSTIKELIKNPELFEKELHLNQSAFTNFGDCEDFGDVDKGFNYANSLQLRYLPRNNDAIKTNSYFRSQKAHQYLVTALSQLISEDYSDFLAYGTTLPDFILKGAEAAKKSLITQTKLSFFYPPERLNLYAFEKQQKELYKGLVQNPRKELYGSIIELEKADKSILQERLRKEFGEESKHAVYPFSLCLYLRGYTYYDLIQEAAAELFVNDKIYPKFKSKANESYQFIMDMVDLFSIPSSIKKVTMSGETYLKLHQLLHEQLGRHKYNPINHQFIQPASGIYYEDYLFDLEVKSAITCILRHARLAKEHGYGHDVQSQTKRLYQL